jgi:hypothetical protein
MLSLFAEGKFLDLTRKEYKCQLTTLTPTKCTILFPDILYYSIMLNTATRFDPLWDHQGITLK